MSFQVEAAMLGLACTLLHVSQHLKSRDMTAFQDIPDSASLYAFSWLSCGCLGAAITCWPLLHLG